MKTSIRRERSYPQSPERVWAALTEPAEISTWFMQTDDFAPVEGQTFTLTDPDARGWSGIEHGTVLSAQPVRHLSYRWQAAGESYATTATWDLTPIAEGGTRLRLRHEGFQGLGGLVTRVMLDFGWRGVLRKNLTDQLATSPPTEP